MRRLVAALGAVVVLLAGCTGGGSHDDYYTFTGATAHGSTIPAAKRQPAGPMTGTLLDGAQFRLASESGKVVVLNYWASWCPPCVGEMPQFDALWQRVHASGIDFVGVNTHDTASAATAFVHENEIGYPIVVDENGKTLLQLGHHLRADLPSTMLIDKHGRVAAFYLGPLTAADLQPALQALLAER